MTKPLFTILLLFSLVAGCATNKEDRHAGSSIYGRLPPCQVDSSGQNFITGRACEGTSRYYLYGQRLIHIAEYDQNGNTHGLEYFLSFGDGEPEFTCTKGPTVLEVYEGRNPWSLNIETITESCATALDEVAPTVARASGTTNVSTPEQRLNACDSFGFKRGTEAHAECAMQLYMNEQNQGATNAVTSSNNQQSAAIARQQAIQEATLREQKRIQELEASLRMMQFGIDLMNGTTSNSSNAPKTQTQTYSINGQIINCTTTGSVTNCF